MTPDNYLNIPKSYLDRKIYRVISFDRMVEMFAKRQNTLRRPHTWKDPFENLIRSVPLKRQNGETGNFSFSNDVYGQCWTLHNASDVMWSAFSGDFNHVRIRTTIRLLAESLSKNFGKWAMNECFIGRVDYLSSNDLKEFIRTIFMNGISSKSIARTYFVKRNAFRHEKEVRLLHIKKDPIPDDLFEYQIDPHNLITQIMIHPLLPKPDAINLKKQIIGATGYKGEFKRSLLYKLSKDLVFETRL